MVYACSCGERRSPRLVSPSPSSQMLMLGRRRRCCCHRLALPLPPPLLLLLLLLDAFDGVGSGSNGASISNSVRKRTTTQTGRPCRRERESERASRREREQASERASFQAEGQRGNGGRFSTHTHKILYSFILFQQYLLLVRLVFFFRVYFLCSCECVCSVFVCHSQLILHTGARTSNNRRRRNRGRGSDANKIYQQIKSYLCPCVCVLVFINCDELALSVNNKTKSRKNGKRERDDRQSKNITVRAKKRSPTTPAKWHHKAKKSDRNCCRRRSRRRESCGQK